jgi:hypothetical protein
MTHAIRIFFARRAYARASKARREYDSRAAERYDIRVAAALCRRETAAANRLAALIDPGAILSAF